MFSIHNECKNAHETIMSPQVAEQRRQLVLQQELTERQGREIAEQRDHIAELLKQSAEQREQFEEQRGQIAELRRLLGLAI